ncbi:MAG: formate dehydrogenase accessory sulfurtransferase FdhD [Pseudomonadota bacterium]
MNKTNDQPLRSASVVSLPDGGVEARELVVEAPVAIVFQGETVAVMMATPSDLEDFAIGFAFTEGFIAHLDDIDDLSIHRHERGYEARFWLKGDLAAAFVERRRSMMGPVGCGLCGIDSIEAAVRKVPDLSGTNSQLTALDLVGATDRLRAHQPLHDQTHAAHGAGFFLAGEEITRVREDVGRHNALDKLIGSLARDGVDPSTGAIVLTSRISVELVQKVAIASCPIVVAVSSPTAFAVNTAEDAGITLARANGETALTVFSHPGRLK